jgi:UrcA family protein
MACTNLSAVAWRLRSQSHLGAKLLLCAALSLSASAALAQNGPAASPTPSSNIDVQNTNPTQDASSNALTVQARRNARHQVVGQAYAGIPIEQVTLTRQIGYGDVDIHSPNGIVTLRRRIFRTAREACQQLSGVYPAAIWTSSDAECVNDAVDSALAQLPSNVAAAVDIRRQLR